ncbi:hypothetical protein [Streptomyces sp. SS]|uniref:hypothetical protein n=1 Tax=Streptomyces sp. SS TaxID=260742 RepID=UPI0003235B0F|nr:hypothetical protein [Streptomyces sp. SS]
MDPIVVAEAASTALVGAMATDAWRQARDGVVALWRRVHPERAEDVGEDLTRLHEIVGDGEGGAEAGEAMARLWQLRLRDLLLADAELTTELTGRLARLTDEIVARNASAGDQGIGTQHLEAHATGEGRVYQAGRDLNVTER